MSSLNEKSTQPGVEVGTVKANQDEGFKLPVVNESSSSSEPKKLWRSLAEKNESEVFKDSKTDEFLPGAGNLSALDRRGFLQLLGGTAAVAGTACWRPPEEKIYPYTKAPENVPGVPQHYASTLAWQGYGMGVVVESYDGRPIKIEGNPLHPATRGKTSMHEQAELYRLYDPQRSKEIRRRGNPQAWADFQSEMLGLMQRHLKDGGEGLRFLFEPTTSPTIQSFREQLQQNFPKSRAYAWQPVSLENQVRGAVVAFGAAQQPTYDLTRARVIVSLDSDFFAWEPDRLRLQKEWADRRVPEAQGGMNRTYVVEPQLSITGMQADHRLRVKPSQVLAVARGLAQALGGELSSLGGGEGLSEKAQKFVKAVAEDLSKNRGTSVVMAGFRQPPAVHALAHAINASLGNLGKTVRLTPAPLNVDDGVSQLAALSRELQSGSVETLIIDAWNPVYSAPAEFKFAELLKGVKNSVYFQYYEDETAKACNWSINAAHELESWGDLRGPDGTVALVQPLIAPLFNGVPRISFYAALFGQAETTAYELLHGFYAQRGATDDATWRKWIAEGVVPDTATAVPPAPQLNAAGVSQAVQATSAAAGEGLELNIVPDYRVIDGRMSNVTWMQELPDPVTKVTWENAVVLSPTTARRLGVELGSWVKLTVRDTTVEGPVYVLPGHADDVATVAMGYGRTSPTEQIANQYGFNVNQLRFSDAMWFQPGLKLEDTGRTYELAVTQDHWSMEGRDMALQADITDHEGLKEQVWRNRNEITPSQIMQEPVDYSKGYKWGMSIDLSRCTACNACVIACQAENNIPIVGKDQVIRAREMHWLMIDRYFVGEDDGDPEVIPQPRMCVHCETAPCEYVCPVNATVHSDEGLNDMVYNRCVGTRYCSNNCPYKVRRFNYLHWNYGKSQTEKMMMNPEVTVRARGVMEKCTYCVQRIERARITTRIEGRRIKDGDIVTACQQACPTDTIVFGDLNDPNSRVSKLKENERRYDLLYELGTRPRTGHMVRIKNYNPALVSQAASTEEHQ